MWSFFEAIHAVTYFSPTCRSALAATGLRGFWMGYFAGRAAPLGPVGPAVVTATFFNFHPSMVARAIPDVWTFASPTAVLDARRSSAAAVLREVHPAVDGAATSILPVLADAVAADASGRALFGANRELGQPDDPVEALWQGCTSLREHRGDGHVAALVAHGLDGCEALVTLAAADGIPAELFLAGRGWSEDDWQSARGRLTRRGLLAGEALSPTGSALRAVIEATTDRLAATPYDGMSDGGLSRLAAGLEEVAAAVSAAGIIPFPNEIGLPGPISR